MKQASHNQNYSQAGLQGGLSLIELMISITIGLQILAALSTLFINQSKSRVELDKSNRMIDNGRYALELFSNNLRLAGFYDNFAPIGTPTTLYNPCTTDNTDSAINMNVLNLHVQGYNAATSSSNVSSPPCGLTYTAGSNLTLQPGSDILTVRRASTAAKTPAAAAAAGGTYLQVSMCQTDAATPPNNYQIVSATAVVASSASMHNKNCTTVADLREFKVTTYFVSPDNVVGDGIPTLKSIDQYGNVTPLVEGIEYMQIDYGVDTDGDGAADLYTDCSTCTVAYWASVMSVRINIVARNQETTTGWTDSKTYDLGLAGTVTPGGAYKRHAYTQMVRLNNPAGRREVP